MKCLKSSFLSGLFSILIATGAFAQIKITEAASRQNSLRGGNGSGRKNWDVLHYAITFGPDFFSKSITGICEISYLKKDTGKIQIDLQEPLLIDSIFSTTKHSRHNISFTREGNVFWVDDAMPVEDLNATQSITIYYHGNPKIAANPPWDGGWVFTTDAMGNPWMSVACQGTGASCWYPCKDIQSDEPDSGAVLSIIVPDTLVGIGNGRLKEIQSLSDHRTCYSWEVKNPINNYNIIPYIGKYVSFAEVYAGKKGALDISYWVLQYNEKKARSHFKEVVDMMKSFEYWMGPYPFYEDGYKLVEAPYLGMEHQSAVAYGNEYKQGYLGADRSGTGIGLLMDFIIIHESGHEWFGNNITTADVADLWVHEGFTSYSEVLYLETQYGKEAAFKYCRGVRDEIDNAAPIIGRYGVQDDPSARTGDMYWKASNMIHTIRQITNDDDRFRNMLIKMNTVYHHRIVTSAEIESFICQELGIHPSVFDQYLRTTKIPRLEYNIKGNALYYRWANAIAGLNMPIDILIAGKKTRLHPNKQIQKMKLKIGKNIEVKVDANYLITTGVLPS